ncbi:hypothetical protein SS50377_24463 [Spironucleus salmonicida]|uniref:Uncharacterized protein n=1 Tax=Spironucleus salmonicida TaxID=348837 RepID=V6LYT4_9EUKA|nr:hypothetical protein SS50377_24463 [Spironucleus salmonicida]|eukprot:EST45989.1 Hypothetical protein SS50377_13971 [Spironucleus salmonicida]
MASAYLPHHPEVAAQRATLQASNSLQTSNAVQGTRLSEAVSALSASFGELHTLEAHAAEAKNAVEILQNFAAETHAKNESLKVLLDETDAWNQNLRAKIARVRGLQLAQNDTESLKKIANCKAHESRKLQKQFDFSLQLMEELKIWNARKIPETLQFSWLQELQKSTVSVARLLIGLKEALDVENGANSALERSLEMSLGPLE